MNYQVNKAVVIGAGTMGSAIAAHLANAGVKVTLLDIIPNQLTAAEKERKLTLDDPEARNRFAREGLQKAIKSKPASFFSKEISALVSFGNLEDDFPVISDTDWVIEAVIEDLDIKRNLMRRIDEVRADDTIVSTNTSGIPISTIADGLSEDFKRHFLGTHFFNPPRYLRLIEIIPLTETSTEVLEFISWFCEFRLGKGVVQAKDTPNFIANRLFAASAAYTLEYILENGYTVPEVDAVTGPPIGNPKTATFRLFDLIGLDVWQHVGRNLKQSISEDTSALTYINSPKVNNLIDVMVKNGWLGNKVKQGFYKQVLLEGGKKEFWSLNLSTLEYDKPEKPRFGSIGKVKDVEDIGERLRVLVGAEDRAGELVRHLLYQSLAYASESIPGIADTPKQIDDAMRWGFNKEAGPFEAWDMLGVEKTSQEMKKLGFIPAPWVEKMISSGKNSFYQYKNGVKFAVFYPLTGEYEKLIRPAGMVLLKEKKAEGKIVSKNMGASLIDLSDGVLCLEFHTKMNTLDVDIFSMMEEGLDVLEKEYIGMVIGNEADHFSAGANLFLVVMAAQNKDWVQLEDVIKKMQNNLMRIRYFSKPIVAAPAGMALGGGGEIIMSSPRVVAAAELYTGQVEISPGVIPAGGGTKELLRRILNPPMRTKDALPLPYLQRIFEQIGFGKVSTSAEEAREMGMLNKADRIVMNRAWLLSEAKKEVLHMASSGYKPPVPEKIYAAGRDALSAIKVGAWMLQKGGYITAHEKLIAQKLAIVMTGGNLSAPAWVEEQYILDLEREAFLSLCGEEKTQQRMWNLLQTGKVLRN
ncbi:MAG: 3-hydroxyacyl-CoA dehydrogenase NAD-binding domain-containing protein [Anaerolineales bacterium]|jgi:3-hydroxyacyl-CoA dehydrogenase